MDIEEKQRITQRMEALSDEELIQVLENDRRDYLPEALAIANEILTARGYAQRKNLVAVKSQPISPIPIVPLTVIDEKDNAIDWSLLSPERIELLKNWQILRDSRNGLLGWGIFNIVFWFFASAPFLSSLAPIPSPSFSLQLFAYGGLLIGAAQIAFGWLGRRTKGSFILLLDAISFFAVGTFNIAYLPIGDSLLKPYGYFLQMDEKAGFWALLGIVQIFLGVRQMLRFVTMQNRYVLELEESALDKSLETLQTFLKAKPSPANGRIRARRGSYLYSFSSQLKDYEVKLFEDHAWFIEKKFEHDFRIDRTFLPPPNFLKSGKISLVSRSGEKIEFQFDKGFRNIFSNWLVSAPRDVYVK